MKAGRTTTRTAPAGAANSTADRAIEILLLFSREKPDWSLAEISERFQMPRSTTYRYLSSLRAHALIVQDAHGRLSLGPRLPHMAQIARASHSVAALASGPMRELADRFKEAVVLNERVGQEIMCLERLDSPHRIMLKATQSQMLPWPVNGSAKVLLAFCDPAEADDIIALLKPVSYTEKSITSVPKLLKHLKLIQQQGFATTDEERDEGVWGASVPIMEGERCHHALSVVGPVFRVSEERQREIIDALLKTATQISEQLR